jgi:hypothetical protein
MTWRIARLSFLLDPLLDLLDVRAGLVIHMAESIFLVGFALPNDMSVAGIQAHANSRIIEKLY